MIFWINCGFFAPVCVTLFVCPKLLFTFEGMRAIAERLRDFVLAKNVDDSSSAGKTDGLKRQH